MGRVARSVAVGYRCHLTHRGNRREAVFFEEEDRVRCLADFAEGARRYALDVWAYCLMSNQTTSISWSSRGEPTRWPVLIACARQIP